LPKSKKILKGILKTLSGMAGSNPIIDLKKSFSSTSCHFKLQYYNVNKIEVMQKCISKI